MKTENNKEVTVIEKKYDDVIEQIHNEFDTAHEVLLTQAKEIISGADSKTEKASRLKSMGFGKAKDVKESERELQIRTLAEQTAKIVNYYSMKYPLFKFITPDQAMTIAEKYNLVLGNVSDFIGFVPDKNLKEMERFKCDDSDIEYNNVWGSPAKREKKKFQIVAPQKDFDMTGKVVVGRKIQLEIKDPVVLQPVRYGYLIVTAWGDEASDPIVVNQINN